MSPSQPFYTTYGNTVIRNRNSLETRAVSHYFTNSSRNVNIDPMIQYKMFTKCCRTSVYLSGDSLEELYELLEGGFLDDDADFNKESDVGTSTEEIK